MLAAFSTGSFLALLVYFKHDWASMISSFLQVIIFRKRPMSLDERMPFFILVSAIPTVATWYYLHEQTASLRTDPLIVAAILAGAGLPLWFADTMSRKNKGMFDWNWLDAFVTGVLQTLFVVPGAGRMMGGLTGAGFRNYNREAAGKFVLFAATPLLAGSMISRLREVDFHSAMPMADMSWLSFYLAMAISFLTGLIGIGAFMKHIQRNGMGQYFIYRCMVAAAVGITFWLRNRTG